MSSMRLATCCIPACADSVRPITARAPLERRTCCDVAAPEVQRQGRGAQQGPRLIALGQQMHRRLLPGAHQSVHVLLRGPLVYVLAQLNHLQSSQELSCFPPSSHLAGADNALS